MSRRTEKGPALPDNPEDENAAAKLWAVYVSEAEKYDKSLVESWKSDMEGMLIFAGLFSASLTAFLIESYKTLIPDSGDATVLLLAQISQQLAASSNGTTLNFVAPAPFTPLASSLVCNILWFISLGLSLTCALVATLLEQWARDFLHKTEIRSAPVIRARVFSYLYYGLKKFGMHTVVEIIPLLLHASLLFFFAGLVAFLLPINTVITAIAAAILGTVTIVYAIITVLPLSYPDCPYRTPLSGGFWNLRRSLQASFTWARTTTETMVEGVFRGAQTPSPERERRDEKSLVWTVKSLTDDSELEPLLEAIPDVLWGRDHRRLVYDVPIRRIINDPDSDLLGRVRDFRDSCYSRVLPVEVAKRRQISCYKAIWALGSLSTPGNAVQIPVPYVFQIDPDVAPYYSSARAIQAWAYWCAAKQLLDTTSVLLTRASTATVYPQDLALNQQIQTCLQELDEFYNISFAGTRLFRPSHNGSSIEAPSWAAQSIADEITDLPLWILLQYLADANGATKISYRYDETQRLLSPPRGRMLSPFMLLRVETALHDIVYTNLETIKEEEDFVWSDTVFGKIVSYWDQPEGALPWAVVEYLATRKCDNAVHMALLAVPERAWKRLPETIIHGPAGTHPEDGSDDALATSLSAVWRLCTERLSSGHSRILRIGEISTWEATLVALWEAEQRSSAPSVVAMVKRVILHQLELTVNNLSGQDLLLQINQPLRLTPSLPLVPEDIVPDGTSEEEIRTMLRRRYGQAELDNLTEFLQQCSSNDLLINPGETMRTIGAFTPCSGIQSAQQVRFATAVENLFAKGTIPKTLPSLAEFSRLKIWEVYRTETLAAGDAWLDEPRARETVQATLRTYLETLPPGGNLFAHIRQIVASMHRLHGENESNSL
ncbi:hypothetical protein C8R46DRAFT_1118776 [Mycena filopes]|nr:hypothetical protein C8R46DRAFT_1118776 [Mycena filopes]